MSCIQVKVNFPQQLQVDLDVLGGGAGKGIVVATAIANLAGTKGTCPDVARHRVSHPCQVLSCFRVSSSALEDAKHSGIVTFEGVVYPCANRGRSDDEVIAGGNFIQAFDNPIG